MPGGSCPRWARGGQPGRGPAGPGSGVRWRARPRGRGGWGSDKGGRARRGPAGLAGGRSGPRRPGPPPRPPTWALVPAAPPRLLLAVSVSARAPPPPARRSCCRRRARARPRPSPPAAGRRAPPLPPAPLPRARSPPPHLDPRPVNTGSCQGRHRGGVFFPRRKLAHPRATQQPAAGQDGGRAEVTQEQREGASWQNCRQGAWGNRTGHPWAGGGEGPGQGPPAGRSLME